MMRNYQITVTERVQKVYEVKARNGTEAAIAVSKLRDADEEPVSTTTLDTRLSAPKVVQEDAKPASEPENAAGYVK